MYRIVLLLLMLTVFTDVNAQIRLNYEMGANIYRKMDYIPNSTSIITYNSGISFCYYPLSYNNRFAIHVDANGMYTGYDQTYDQVYKFRFVNAVFISQASYLVMDNIALKAGIYASSRLQMRPENAEDNYEEVDWGWSCSLNFFEFKRIGLSVSLMHGMNDLVKNYPRIDAQGNFLKPYSGFRITNISLGTFFNIYNERIGKK